MKDIFTVKVGDALLNSGEVTEALAISLPTLMKIPASELPRLCFGLRSYRWPHSAVQAYMTAKLQVAA